MWQWIMTLVLLTLAVPVEAESVSWLQRCEAALAQGQVNEVLRSYQQAITATPEQRVVVAISLGEALSRAGRFDEAKQILTEAVRQAQGLNQMALEGEVNLRLGQIAAAKGKTKQAYDYFQQALQQAEQTQQHQLAAASALNAFKQQSEFGLLHQTAQHLKQLTNKAQQTEWTI